jgi:hypothetical protein
MADYPAFCRFTSRLIGSSLISVSGNEKAHQRFVITSIVIKQKLTEMVCELREISLNVLL